ncbi:metallophosphoesterase [Carboxylicivirga sp. M1479]|uniref:metallophosphoesterase family protein n=1 Tax=Carboxylicivirga sp. M1479 TaxID=2594476 RepID=UPI001177856B|nr:metallophosphoesterase [Carboxylicivirga sp. M1479]TRX71240.1 metallophosphoesterase [Carboxylicivirga sp. M1479]
MRVLVILFSFLITINSYAQVDTDRMKFKHKPYVQAVTNHSASILFATTQQAVASVFISEQGADGQTITNSTHGLVNAGDKLHTLDLKNLKEGTTYTYRAIARQLMQLTPYYTYYGDTIYSDTYRFTTRSSISDTTRFIVMADIHGDTKKLQAHINTSFQPDFYLFNGDVINDFHREEDFTECILKPSIELFAAEKPFYYCRGNHETRGFFARRLFDYIDTPSGKPYYTISQGPLLIIVMDVGEDKPDDNRYYYGLANFDAYRQEQSEWLKDVVKSDAFKKAKYKIVCSHIPFLGLETAYPVDKKVYAMWGPILEKAKIDLMISGHTHEYFWYTKEKSPAKYPVLITDNKQRAEVLVNENGISIKVVDTEQNVIEVISLD